MTQRKIRVNDRGRRIGEGHHNAKLTDAEVDRLLAEREAGAALGVLARRWGVSKSCVAGICNGRRRGQIGPSVDRALPKRPKETKVSVRLTMTLRHRAKLHRLGGSRWLARLLELDDAHAPPEEKLAVF